LVAVQASCEIDDVALSLHGASRRRISRYFCHAQQNGEGICTASDVVDKGGQKDERVRFGVGVETMTGGQPSGYGK
jgi:hypothetical protein